MLIPIDVLEKAIVGDMFKTPTERQFEQEGAFGDPRSQIFYAAVAGEPGGGGTGASEFADMSVGVGGGSPGSDGGWGGGKGGGIGAGEGSGKASWGFANRGSKELMIRRNNPGKQWKPILDQTNLALRWLAYHQEGDGRWDAVKYGSSVKTDTAVTGLALLALLGAGHTEKVGEYAGNVRKAVAWLKSKQAADGCIWDTTDDGAGHRRVGYPNAIATLAIAEAAGMANIPDTREAAKKAIEYACNIHQSGEGYDKLGWRYGPKSEGDLSVTGWYIMALKSAKVSALPVPAASIDGAIKFLDSVEKRDNDASGYSASQYKYMAGNEHAHTAHRLTAIGTLSRQYLGWKKDELQGSVDWFVNKGGVPNAGANGEGTDLYYWYYGSLCVFQQGGDLWKRWNEGMLKSLLPTQCKHGDDQGSWNPVGDYSSEWGRVGQTALSVLCLEVYYRYDQLKNMK
ncbi:MAG TPA: hypothetical protein VEK08_23910 [Planctomycetota bacterium]|nr:hypothetical protein [Planctomycetota bacterium]